jgi:chromosome segregation ATPase
MVFGWGKKKQEEVHVNRISQEKEINLLDISKIIIDLEELRKSQTLSEIKQLRDDTAPLIDELIKIGTVLDNDNLKVDDIDKHLAIIVVRGKKQVIDVIKKGVIQLPKISSINDAKKLDLTLNQLLKKLGDVLGRQTRVIHIFAKKYATQLKGNLEVMTTNHSEIHKLLKNYDSTKSLSDEITELLNKINSMKNEQLVKTQKIDVTNNDIDSFNQKITLLETSIEEKKSSEDYKKYLDLKNKLDSFNTLKLKIKNDIDTQFTKISRPLSRYEYVSSLDKDQKIILSILVKNPIDVLVSQNKDSIIVILENVKKGISSGSISVKDVDKSLSQITEIEETLDGFVKRVSEYSEKYKKMSDELNSLKSEELVSLESELTKNLSSRDDSKKRSETIQDELDELKSKIPQLVSEIEVKLRQFSNTKYTVISS